VPDQLSFRVLTVCTGNVCRSPMAEIMLRHCLSGVGAAIASAGTGALVGQPMTPEARSILEGLGLADEPPHVARALTPQLVRSAHLILGLTREHRRKVVELDPSATRRAFTLREFGYVAGHVTPSDLDAAERQLAWRQGAQGGAPARLHPLEVAVTAVFAVNGVFPIPDPAELDVPDPYGQPIEAYAAAAVRMMPAIEALGDYLTSAARRPLGGPAAA
jgi:protein-tyrosine phosphatase